MADQESKFLLEQKNSFMSGSDLTVRFDIKPVAPDDKALLAHVEDLDRATNTLDSTRNPTSQVFDKNAQTISFTIPVRVSDSKDMIYTLAGGITIDGIIYRYNYTLTVAPVSVVVEKLYDDGIDMIMEFGYLQGKTKKPITVPGVVTLNTASYIKEGAELKKISESTDTGTAKYTVEVELYEIEEPRLFVAGAVSFEFPEYTVLVPFSFYQQPSSAWTDYPKPLADYAAKNMWGHRELDNQYQLKLGRISPKAGLINNFMYMGRSFLLPNEKTFYHVFSMGGFDINFWNMGQRKNDWWPYGTWKPLSEISHERGVVLDVYNGRGRMYPRADALILNTFQGITFIAFPDRRNWPMPMDKNMYIRCYSSDINLASIPDADKPKFSFGYYNAEFNSPDVWDNTRLAYAQYTNFGMGRVIFYVNGVVTDITKHAPLNGDIYEIYYDPTVGKIHTYRYEDMADFYSTMDKKRKVIVFPGDISKPYPYEYHDDLDLYVMNRRTGQGLYYHRNSVDAIRQLTHRDYSMTGQYIDFLIGELIALDTSKKSTAADMDIQVSYRETRWKFNLGPTSSRIKDLYLLEDPEKILRAMTGAQSTVKEWSAPELEQGATNKVLNAVFQELTTPNIREALGYNGCSMALSASPMYMPYILPGDPNYQDLFPTPPFETGLGYRIPASYVENSTAYEYDANGLLLRRRGIVNTEWYKPGDQCWYVEFVIGQSSTWLDYEISRSDVKIRPGHGFRVYKAGWLIDPTDPTTPDNSLFQNEFEIVNNGKDIYPKPYEVRIYGTGEPTRPDEEVTYNGGRPDGNWVDITDTDEYEILNGYIVWKFDTVNYVGMAVFDTVHLYNEFELTHIDNSISFQILHTWDIGGLPLKIEPGQLDLWFNNHPAIENVDYYVDFPNIYVVSKMWLNANGRNTFAYRARGLSGTGLIPSSELGFVYDGVLGINGQYNLRIDRPTRTIINGRLYLTEALDASENLGHGNNVAALNGFPYEVKHIYCDNKYVEQFDMHWGFEKARDLDQRISEYLTTNASYHPKDPVDIPYLEEDRYRLFSPFMSQLANEMNLGFLRVPLPTEGEIGYSDQAIDDLTRPYQWLLKYEPFLRGLDERYFMTHPYSNADRITVTPNQLTVLSRANELYLGGKIRMEGFFEVKHDV